MGRVRPFVESDVEEVVQLNSRSFPGSLPRSPEEEKKNFVDVFLSHPWRDIPLPPLVYEDGTGRVIGFLGVIPRVMNMNGKSITVATSQHLMADRERGSAAASLELMRTFLKRDQDLAIADMADLISRKLWERLGGQTSKLHSMHWKRPLRPVRFAQQTLARRVRRFEPVSPLFSPLARTADFLLTRASISPYHLSSDVTGSELDLAGLQKCLTEFTGNYSLRPQYTDEQLQWLISMVRAQKHFGELKAMIVKDKEGRGLGWYICYVREGHQSEVIQIGAAEESVSRVVDHLFYASWKGGATAVGGRLDPRHMEAFRQNQSLFLPGSMWMLVHSRHPEILQAIFQDKAFLSRLEGDLWLV